MVAAVALTLEILLIQSGVLSLSTTTTGGGGGNSDYDDLHDHPDLTDAERAEIEANRNELERDHIPNWDVGTFDSVGKSMSYHYLQHGKARFDSVMNYFRSALARLPRNARSGWSSQSVGDATRWTSGNGQWFIIIRNGRIVSFGKNR
jgi:hypothetical protein